MSSRFWGLSYGPFPPSPPPDRPLRRTTQNFALFFFPLSAGNFILSSLSGGLLEFWWCLKRRSSQMCPFGLSDKRVKPRRHRSRHCFTQQPENSNRAHLKAQALQTPPKFHEKTPEKEEKNEFCGGRGKEKREILGPPPFGPPPFLGSGPTLPGPHPSGPKPLHRWGPFPLGPPPPNPPTRPDHRRLKKKYGQIRSGQIRSNKIGQIRPNKVGQMWYWPNLVWPIAVATPGSAICTNFSRMD